MESKILLLIEETAAGLGLTAEEKLYFSQAVLTAIEGEECEERLDPLTTTPISEALGQRLQSIAETYGPRFAVAVTEGGLVAGQTFLAAEIASLQYVLPSWAKDLDSLRD